VPASTVDLERHHPRSVDSDPAELGLTDRPVVGHIGRLTRWKRVENLSHAAAQPCRTRHPGTTALIVDAAHPDQEPGYEAELRALIAELDLGDGVNGLLLPSLIQRP